MKMCMNNMGGKDVCFCDSGGACIFESGGAHVLGD